MRRIAVVVAFAAVALWCAYGQVSRDAYRLAYRNWRQADPNLEHDSGAGGPLLAQRAEQLTEQARAYGVERSAFLQQLADETQRGLAWIESPASVAPGIGNPAAARAAAEIVSVKRTMDAYANDPDPGLQRVRMMLERENLTLSALNNAIQERQRKAEEAAAAMGAVRTAQAGALEKERDVITALKQATAQSDREREAWSQYYRLVADAARGPEDAPATSLAPLPSTAVRTVTLPPPATPAPPVRTVPQASAPPDVAPVVTTPAPAPEPPAPPVRTAPQVAAPSEVTPPPTAAPAPKSAPPPETVTASKAPPPSTPTPEPQPPPAAPETPAVSSTAAPDPPVTPRPSITPVPLIRYTGTWILPLTKPIFHGPEPEVLELVVNEESGRASGTLTARFKLPPGASDPNVSFSFTGEFHNTRNQVFELHSSDGSGGRIELIPGPAFNLLEINFLVEAGPGKIRQANAILIKK
jgi:hypothetical protein